MKPILLLFISLCITMILQAQVSKTINITAGKLKMVLTSEELSTVTNLTLSGTIDARDFKTMRDDMPELIEIDLSRVKIIKYVGTLGTSGKNTIIYQGNVLPNYAFYNPFTQQSNVHLNTIVLPSSVTTIGYMAFKGCRSLSSINIPSKVTAIKGCAFMSCVGLETITIPPAVVTIDGKAFAGCNALSSIYANSSCPVDLSSSADVFDGINKTTCILHVSYLAKVRYIASNQWNHFNTIVEAEQGFLVEKNNLKFGYTANSTTVDVVSNVNWNVHSDQAWLKVTPDSGSGIQTLTITAESNVLEVPRSGKVTMFLEGVGSQTIIVTQNDSPTIVKVKDFNSLSSSFLNSITRLRLTDTIDAVDIWFIARYMPSLNMLDLSEATIRPLSYEVLEDDGDMKILEDYPDYDYDFIRLLYNKFRDQKGYPANEFPPDAFSYYSYWNGRVIMSRDSLKTVILPSSLTSIGDEAFKDCSGLSSVTIPTGVTRIGNGAFSGDTSLISITIPETIKTIGSGAFSGCTSLTSITIPESVKTIGAGAFSGCIGLTSITVPSGVTTIDSEAFSNCTGLISVNIPASVIYLGDDAFSNCSNLTAFFLGSHNFYQICDNYIDSFSGINDGKCTLYVPRGSKDAYDLNSYLINFKDIVEFSFIELSVAEISIPTSKDTIENVTIWSDLTWNVNSDQPWLILDSNSGTGDQTLYFGVEDNTSAATRAAKITFSALGVESQIVFVTQEGGTTALPDLAENSIQFKCFPNPFTDEIVLEIQNPKRAKITVDIYNVTGERIKNLAIQRKNEKLDLKWNGTNDLGRKVSPGVYICKVNNHSKQLIYQENSK